MLARSNERAIETCYFPLLHEWKLVDLGRQEPPIGSPIVYVKATLNQAYPSLRKGAMHSKF